MGLDQHRAQITAEWIDTATGEVSRARVAPGDRAGVRRVAARFRGEDLEVALEATTGWRFVAEEFTAAGARVHLAEPAETAARRGKVVQVPEQVVVERDAAAHESFAVIDQHPDVELDTGQLGRREP